MTLFQEVKDAHETALSIKESFELLNEIKIIQSEYGTMDDLVNAFSEIVSAKTISHKDSVTIIEPVIKKVQEKRTLEEARIAVVESKVIIPKDDGLDFQRAFLSAINDIPFDKVEIPNAPISEIDVIQDLDLSEPEFDDEYDCEIEITEETNEPSLDLSSFENDIIIEPDDNRGIIIKESLNEDKVFLSNGILNYFNVDEIALITKSFDDNFNVNKKHDVNIPVIVANAKSIINHYTEGLSVPTPLLTMGLTGILKNELVENKLKMIKNKSSK